VKPAIDAGQPDGWVGEMYWNAWRLWAPVAVPFGIVTCVEKNFVPSLVAVPREGPPSSTIEITAPPVTDLPLTVIVSQGETDASLRVSGMQIGV
jgi:hypothetical protein